MSRSRRWPSAVLVAAFAWAFTRVAHAIPAFARAYEVPCSTCHSAITRRNEFGDLFRKHGFRWPGGAEVDREGRRPIEMPGIALMRGLLPSKVPIGFSATLSAAISNDPSASNPTLGRPLLNLLYGTALSNHVAVFGTWSLARAVPNETYLHFARLFGRPEANVRLGLLEPTTTLFRANEALLARYTLSTATLSGFTLAQPRVGGEVNGMFFGRTFIAGGVVQNGDPGSNFDVYYHVSEKLGGRSLLGERPITDPYDLSVWDRVRASIGHWGYFGRVRGSDGEKISQLRRFGVDAKLEFEGLGLGAGVMFGFDRDFVNRIDSRSVTWLAEVSYAARPWLMPMYIVQYQDGASFVRPSVVHDIGVVVLPLENLRVRVKATFSDDKVRNETADLQLLLGF